MERGEGKQAGTRKSLQSLGVEMLNRMLPIMFVELFGSRS